jgi:putative nucleotidyltransferase with HDIG domain
MLNRRGYTKHISIFISTLLYVLTTYSLIDGVGLQDAGMIAYPLLIVFTSFMINRLAALITAILSIGSVLLVYFLDRMGLLDPSVYSNEDQILVIIVLLIATGFLLWAVMENWERIMQNLIETYDLTLSGWSKALEFRDQETEGHSQRVVELTVKIAKRLGMSETELQDIRRGALLHDIGKMAIPDKILSKQGRFTDDEWLVVKKHPGNAKDLLENIPFLKSALDIPYYHHERWDGSGYPEGLTKENIPIAARIFAVVDVWDALTSIRPYRQAWPQKEAVKYIREQSGKLFDPQVVQEFLFLIEIAEEFFGTTPSEID